VTDDGPDGAADGKPAGRRWWGRRRDRSGARDGEPVKDDPSDRVARGSPLARRMLRPQVIIGVLLTMALFIYFIPEIFINVRSGEAGVLWRRFLGGTVTDRVYGEGLHMIFPWDEMYVYNVRVQERERSLSVLTVEGLTATVLISIRYYPDRELVGVLHKRVGPDYVNKIVVPEVDSTVRTAIGGLTAEELYTTRYDIITQVVVEALEQVANNYVTINDVIIRRVQLPALVSEAIEEKIRQKHIADSFVFRIRAAEQEARRKEIEAGGFARYNEIINKSLTPDILKWEGVRATQAFADSDNAKIIIMGNSDKELPVILNGGD
jgi:regulator of protease activity HflC (stomatin/prohibitin superfamily)